MNVNRRLHLRCSFPCNTRKKLQHSPFKRFFGNASGICGVHLLRIPLHDLEIFFGQAVKVKDQTIDLFIAARDLVGKAFQFFGGKTFLHL